MERQRITVEDIERRQRMMSVLIKVFVAVLALMACLFIGWLISFIGYADDLFSSNTMRAGGIEPVIEYVASAVAM